jgi:tyrosinase
MKFTLTLGFTLGLTLALGLGLGAAKASDVEGRLLIGRHEGMDGSLRATATATTTHETGSDSEGYLSVLVKSASNLRNLDTPLVSGHSDCFVRVTVDHNTYLTEVVANSLNPTWNELIKIPLPKEGEHGSRLVAMSFQVVDDDSFMGTKREEVVGDAVAAYNFKSHWKYTDTLPLSKDSQNGMLHIEVKWVTKEHIKATKDILLQVQEAQGTRIKPSAVTGAAFTFVKPARDDEAMDDGMKVMSETAKGGETAKPKNEEKETETPEEIPAEKEEEPQKEEVKKEKTGAGKPELSSESEGSSASSSSSSTTTNPTFELNDKPVSADELIDATDPWNKASHCLKKLDDCWSHKEDAHIRFFTTSPAEPGYPVFFAARVAGINGLLQTKGGKAAHRRMKYSWTFDGDEEHAAEHQECYTVETMDQWSKPKGVERHWQQGRNGWFQPTTNADNAFNLEKENSDLYRDKACKGPVVGYTLPKSTPNSVHYATVKIQLEGSEKVLTAKVPFVVKKYDGPIVKRKEIRALGKDFKNRFVKALIHLKKNGIYDFLVHAHLRSAYFYYRAMGSNPAGHSQAHGGPAFLPWHRLFHVVYEMSIQAADQHTHNDGLTKGGFFVKRPKAPKSVEDATWHREGAEPLGIPWWDHAKPGVFTPDFFGAGDVGDGNTEGKGAFACKKGSDATCNWPINFIDGDHEAGRIDFDGNGISANERTDVLTRNYGCAGERDEAMCVKKQLTWGSRNPDRVITDGMSDPKYGQAPFIGASGFGRFLENNVHNAGHVLVNGDMMLLSSPNDPIFFCHHGQVDRLWWKWQRNAGKFHYTPLAADQYNGKKTELNPSALNLKMCDSQGQSNCWPRPGTKHRNPQQVHEGVAVQDENFNNDPNKDRKNRIPGIGWWGNGHGKDGGKATHVEIRGQMWDSELWPWTNTVADVSCNPNPASYTGANKYFACSKKQREAYVHKVVYDGSDSLNTGAEPKLPECCTTKESYGKNCAC